MLSVLYSSCALGIIEAQKWGLCPNNSEAWEGAQEDFLKNKVVTGKGTSFFKVSEWESLEICVLNVQIETLWPNR
jgi:hypothetical protein